MYIPISVNRNSAEPIYKQVMRGIIESVEKDYLKYGSKLPTERELASEIKISRGTVKKAYEELEKIGIVKIIWGSGAYIVKKDSDSDEDDENILMMKLINLLYRKGYTHKEIDAFIKIRMEKGKLKRKVNIAAISCNIECLSICQKQISEFSEADFYGFIIGELKNYTRPDNTFKDFDIIITGAFHYEDLISIIPESADKILKVNFSPKDDTRFKISEIKSSDKVGIFTKSRKFKDIIGAELKENGRTVHDKDCVYEKWVTADNFEKFLKDKDILLMPPVYIMDSTSDIYESFKLFLKNGKDIINFNFAIEKGSLVYIEEKIADILYNIV